MPAHDVDPMPPLAFRVGRYSSTEGDQQLDRQEADTLKLCDLHGYEDGGWFGLDDESGSVDTRRRQGKIDTPPTLRWAMDRISEAKEIWPKRAVVLVAYKEARLWRDVTQKEELRRFLAKWRDVTWHTTEGLKDPASATDTFVSTVVAGGNQFYADSVRELVVNAHRARAAQLKPATGWPGFGHKREIVSDDGRGNVVFSDRYIIDEEPAALLRAAIGQILGGRPMAHIRNEWIEKGVPSRLGGEWTLTTMRRMFTAPRLAGILVFSGEEIGPSPYIEAIIDEPTLRLLQHRLLDAARRQTRHRLGMQMLTGVLVCGKCGRRLNSTVKGSRTPARSYACMRNGCVSIKASAVERVMKRLLFDALERSGIEAFEVDNSEAVADLLRELSALEAEELELEEVAAELSVPVLHAKSKALRERQQIVREGIEAVSTTGEQATHWIQRKREITEGWESLDLDTKRSALFDVLGQYAVNSGGSGHTATDDVVLARLHRLDGPVPQAARMPPVVGRPRKQRPGATAPPPRE